MNGQNERALSHFTAFWAELSWSASRRTIGWMCPSSAVAAPSPAPTYVGDDLVKVQDDGAVGELQPLRVPFEQVDELGVDRAVRRAPELLDARSLERPGDSVVGDSTELGREGPASGLSRSGRVSSRRASASLAANVWSTM